MRFITQTVRSKLLFALTVIGALAIAGVWTYIDSEFRPTLMKGPKNNIKAAANALYYMISLEQRPETLKRYVQAMNAEADIDYVFMYMDTGEEEHLISSKQAWQDLKLTEIPMHNVRIKLLEIVTNKEYVTDYYGKSIDGNTMFYILPFTMFWSDDHLVKGGIVVGTNLSTIHSLIYEDLFRVSFILFLSILAVMCVGYLILRRYVFNPIQKVNELILKRNEGNIEAILPYKYFFNDDIGVVLRTLNDFLKQESIVRKQLVKAKEEALHLVHAKTDFLANMSHEIRTPMNGISGMVQMLAETPLDKQQKEYVNQLQSANRMLLEILNDILDYSKIESGKMELDYREFNISLVLKEMVNVFKYQYEEKDVKLEVSFPYPMPRMVEGDELKLKQILNNLLSNALKFTEKGSVSLSLETSPEGIVLKVKDTGVGIAPETQERIFDKFDQEDNSTTRRFGGTGLGLTITKSYVELMKGKIFLVSNVGEGSEFTVYLPFKVSDMEDVKVLRSQKILSYLESELTICHQCLEHAGARLATPTALKHSNWDDFNTVVLTRHMLLYNSDVQLNVEAVKRGEINVNLVAVMDAKHANDKTWADYIHLVYQPFVPENLFDAILNIDNKTLPSRQSSNAWNVLLVEDNVINQTVVGAMLKKMGCTYKVANNGKEALDIYERAEDKYDFILMDYHMPIMDGLEATKQIRHLEDEGEEHIPIIALTADVTEGKLDDCLNAGMNAYLTKPISKEGLIATMEDILSENSA